MPGMPEARELQDFASRVAVQRPHTAKFGIGASKGGHIDSPVFQTKLWEPPEYIREIPQA
jgi:hypothetical protein